MAYDGGEWNALADPRPASGRAGDVKSESFQFPSYSIVDENSNRT